MTAIRAKAAPPIMAPYQGVYRAVYDLHRQALEQLPQMSIDAYWLWFWGEAEQIIAATGKTEFVIDLIVALATEIENAQKRGMLDAV